MQILSNIILWWTLAACETANLCLAVLDIFFNEASHFLSATIAGGRECERLDLLPLERDVEILPPKPERSLLDLDLVER